MSQWEDFIKAVESGVASAATGELKNYLNQAQEDAQSFVLQAKADLQTWSGQLATNEITANDLGDYVKADLEIAELTALTEAGVALAALQKFRDDLVQIVTSAATKAFLP